MFTFVVRPQRRARFSSPLTLTAGVLALSSCGDVSGGDERPVQPSTSAMISDFRLSPYPGGADGGWNSPYGGMLWMSTANRRSVGLANLTGNLDTLDVYWPSIGDYSYLAPAGNRLLAYQSIPSGTGHEVLIGAANWTPGTYIGQRFASASGNGLFTNEPWLRHRGTQDYIGSGPCWLVLDEQGSLVSSMDLQSRCIGSSVSVSFGDSPESDIIFLGLDSTGRIYQHVRSASGVDVATRNLNTGWAAGVPSSCYAYASYQHGGNYLIKAWGYLSGQWNQVSVMCDATHSPVRLIQGDTSSTQIRFQAVAGTGNSLLRSDTIWSDSSGWVPTRVELSPAQGPASGSTWFRRSGDCHYAMWLNAAGNTQACVYDTNWQLRWSRNLSGDFTKSDVLGGMLVLVSEAPTKATFVVLELTTGDVRSAFEVAFPSGDLQVDGTSFGAGTAGVVTLSSYDTSSALLLLFPNWTSLPTARIIPKVLNSSLNTELDDTGNIVTVQGACGKSLHIGAGALASSADYLDCLPSVSVQAISVTPLPASITRTVQSLSYSTPSWNFATPPAAVSLSTSPVNYEVHFSTVAPTPICEKPADFVLMPSTSELTLLAGESKTLELEVGAINGFLGIVNFSVAPSITGVTWSFSPSSVFGDGISVVTCQTSASAPQGLHSITLTGSSGGISRSTEVLLNMQAPAPNFSLVATPSAASVTAGSGTNFGISRSAVGGFTGTVSLSAGPTIPGVSYSFSPSSISTGSSTLTCLTSSSATPGTHTITITGTSGALTRTTSVQLTIQSSMAFSIAASPSSTTVLQGSSSNVSIQSTPTGGFSGTVSLSASPAISGITYTFSPTSITASGSSTLSIQASASAAVGSYSITITGTSGVTTRTTTISLTVSSASGGSVVKTYSASPGLSIPDNSTTGVTSTITSGVSQTIRNVAVSVNIQHTYRGDLQLSLIGPDNTSVLLQVSTDDPADNILTTYPLITTPAQSLGAFVGRNSAGTWRLKVVDLAAVDVGVLNSWRITFNGERSSVVNVNIASTSSTDASRSITFTETGLVSAVKVKVGINHSWSGDLEVSLTAPDGTVALLHDETGGSADFLPTVYPDLTIPAQALSAFQNRQIAGTWTLRVRDVFASADGGLWSDWALYFEAP